MPRHVPSIFQICIPQPAENRGLSFFSSKIPARTRLQHPSVGYLPHPIEISPHISHCSSYVFNTASRSMGARDGVENTTLVRARVPRGHQGTPRRSPTPDS